MSTKGLPTVLCVDDEEHILSGLKRILRGRFSVTTVNSGHKALEAIEQHGPFSVIVSDLNMPFMNGITLLKRAREVAPYTVRVLLTGQADLHAAIKAVNEGNVYRFLTKPCTPAELIAGLTAAVEQYRLQVAERVLLEKTLHGSIKTLTDILAMTHPAIFGRATRSRKIVAALVADTKIDDRWAIEISAMLSEIGFLTLPTETAARACEGRQLSEDEKEMVRRLPSLTIELLANIPRLEPVIACLRYQHKQYDGRGDPADTVSGAAIPWGARALKIAHDFDALRSRGDSDIGAVHTMRGRSGWYDPVLLDALASTLGGPAEQPGMNELRLADVRPGMVFAEDVLTPTGALFIAHGQEVTVSLAARLRNLGADGMGDHLVRVTVMPPSERSGSMTELLRLRHVGANPDEDDNRIHADHAS